MGTNTDCPRCGSTLESFNGRIGKCPVHNWVSPAGLGYDQEAADRNEQERLEEEQKKADEERRRRLEEFWEAVRKAVFLLIAFLVITALTIVFLVRPSMNYKQAAEHFSAGEYQTARDEFMELGNYKDSPARIILCDIMINLNNGRIDEAAQMIDRFVQGEGSRQAAEFADAMTPILIDWKQNGLTPQFLLLLIERTQDIIPEGKWDIEKLTLEGHTALLTSPVLGSYAEDVDKDGQTELIVLNPDYSVSAFRMISYENVRIGISDEAAAECELTFGKSFEDIQPLYALACYEAAYKLNGSDEAFSLLADKIRNIVSDWKILSIAPSAIPPLIRRAQEYGIVLAGIDAPASYEEAALAAAGEVVQKDFVDWDNDGYKELLTLDTDGNLSLYGIAEKWQAVAVLDTGLSGCSYVITDKTAPLILIISKAEDELIAVTGTSGKLSELFRETGINQCTREGTEITFSRLLEGSIIRRSEYRYIASGTANRPERTGIDWQRDNYPLPTNAYAAVLRYFESVTYDIPEEASHLTGSAVRDRAFSAETLSALPIPDNVSSLRINPYMTEDKLALFEVEYLSKGNIVRTWVSAEYIDSWKTTGAAGTFGHGLNADDMDTSIPLLSLNEETVHTVSSKGGRMVYRVLIPLPGRVAMHWQSGSKAASRTAYTVTMLRGSLAGDKVFEYNLQPTPNRQQSKDTFVSAGVFYVIVEAKTTDTEEYLLSLMFSEQQNVELENNDTAPAATEIELDRPYYASLSGSGDIDFFHFSLTENCAVNVTVETSGKGGKSSAYSCAVYNATDGKSLSAFEIPGNEPLSETGELYLSSGSYYIRIAKGKSYINDEYTLTVRLKSSGVHASEPNDTWESANIIPINEDITGSFGRDGDLDFYSFTLEEDAVVQPRFSFSPANTGSKTYVLTILDQSRRELLKVDFSGKESSKVVTPLALSAGTYVLKLENPRYIRQNYTIRLISVPTEIAEREPNNSIALATEISSGDRITGVLSSETDIDYYRMVFDQPMSVRLNFTFPAGTGERNAFVLSIESNGNTQWTYSVKRDSGGTEQTIRFPAGEYYLKVKPAAWYGAVYTIDLVNN